MLLPNVRKIFVPDDGYTMVSSDLKGAEAQVVAWEAGDEDLKAAFRAGINVHIKNARDVYPDKVRGWSDEAIKASNRPGGVYYTCKRCVHATHNGGKPKGLAREIPGVTVAEAAEFQKNWYGLHPPIEARNQYVLDCLHGRIEGNPARTVANKFGYRIVFFDRIRNVFTQALTWIQQSTVALNCSLGALQLEAALPWAELLLHLHDELVFQIPTHHEAEIEQIRTALEVEVPYPDPLVIPWTIGMSQDSWGEAK